MIGPARTDTSLVGRWWWTVDRWSLAALGLLLAAGALLVMAASPAVAERIGLDAFHFVRRQGVYLVPAIVVMIGISLMTPLNIRRLAVVGFVLVLALMVATLVCGHEVKGARRWLSIAGFVLQPSEFIKPFFAVVAAWMFAEHQRGQGFPGAIIAALLLVLVTGLLVLQPDFGMTVVIGAVWFAQFFMAGMPMTWIGALALVGLVGIASAYALLPHVASRIDRFLDPASGDSFQVDTALAAFRTGGLTGRGPGEGTVKSILPDAHTDPQGGECKECYNDFGVDFELNEEWTRYVVAFADLKQESGWGRPRPDNVDPKKLFGMQWQVSTRATAFDVWIDDVTFVGCDEKK